MSTIRSRCRPAREADRASSCVASRFDTGIDIDCNWSRVNSAVVSTFDFS